RPLTFGKGSRADLNSGTLRNRVPNSSSEIGGGAWRIRTADPLPARQEQPSSTALVRDQNSAARVLGLPPRVALIVVLIVVQISAISCVALCPSPLTGGRGRDTQGPRRRSSLRNRGYLPAHSYARSQNGGMR